VLGMLNRTQIGAEDLRARRAASDAYSAITRIPPNTERRDRTGTGAFTATAQIGTSGP